MGARFLLLRHGEIAANRTRRWHGSTDSPLTWRGRRQAKRTGRHLSRNETLTAIYTSPLQRCHHTATLAGSAHGVPITPLAGLQEMSIGQWEDMPFRDLVEQHDFIERATQNIEFAPPGGESLLQVAQRVSDAFHHIDDQHAEEHTVLVVSHGVAMAVALAVFLHESPSRWMDYHFDNCSLTEFRLSPDPVVYSFNISAHL